MCGRFILSGDPNDWREIRIRWKIPDDWAERYNVAPTQNTLIATNEKLDSLQWARWGLIPHWAKDPSIGNRLINARAETAAEKPAFRDAFRKHRCLVVASGFYEWQKNAGGKIPHLVYAHDKQPLTFAGLWSTTKLFGEPIRTFTILTVSAAEGIRTIHERMPLVIRPNDYDFWLSPDHLPADSIARLTDAAHNVALANHAVSTLVNSPANDNPDCIRAVSS